MAFGSSSGGHSGRGSGKRCSATATAGRDGGAVEVTTMRAAAIATKTPLPLAMVRDDEREGRFVDQRW